MSKDKQKLSNYLKRKISKLIPNKEILNDIFNKLDKINETNRIAKITKNSCLIQYSNNDIFILSINQDSITTEYISNNESEYRSIQFNDKNITVTYSKFTKYALDTYDENLGIKRYLSLKSYHNNELVYLKEINSETFNVSCPYTSSYIQTEIYVNDKKQAVKNKIVATDQASYYKSGVYYYETDYIDFPPFNDVNLDIQHHDYEMRYSNELKYSEFIDSLNKNNRKKLLK